MRIVLFVLALALLLTGCDMTTTGTGGGGGSEYIELLSQTLVSGTPVRAAITGSALLVLGDPNHFVSLDITDPYYPWVEDDTFCQGVALDAFGDYACVVDVDGLGVWGIDELWNLHELSHGYLSSGADVDVEGTYAYVANRDTGLQVFDISDPYTTPYEVGYYWTLQDAFRIEVEGSYGYMLHPYGMWMLDVTPASDITLMREMTLFNPTDIAIRGSYAYITHEGGLSVVNVGAPYDLAQVGSHTSYTSYNAIAITGNFALVCAGNDGLKLFDISSPAAPVLLDTYYTLGYAWDVVTDGYYVYVCSDTYIETLRLSAW